MIDARSIVSRVGREHRVAVLEAVRMIRDEAVRLEWMDHSGHRQVSMAMLDELVTDLEAMR